MIVYDHRGHGLSDKPKGDYSIRELSDDLYSLMEESRLEKPVIIGFSLGGMVALRFALEHPDRITKLVLVGTTAKMALTMHIVRFLKYILPYKTIARIVCRSKYYKPSDQVIKDALSRAMKVDRYVAYKCLNEFTKNYDIRDMIPLIKVPTLIVVGEKDKLNLKASKYLNRKIENSELRIVSGSGHTVMVEKPDEFNHIVENFIKK
jgi:pimeloyl-ACP methyl ester carboxylesterase